jgi:hypothetical protein
MPALRNFVILYSGREGSSALIDALGRHPRVYVAAFEHLDLGNLREHVDDPKAQIGEILDRALCDGDVPGRARNYAGQPVIGLKWRPFGDAATVRALQRNHSRVIFLYRSNALARALSMTFRPEHTQFRLAKLTAAERASALEDLRNERFVAAPADVADSIRSYRRLKARHWATYCRPEVETKTLEYEWFCSDPLAAVNDVLSFLDLEPFDELPPARFVRTHTDIEQQCENLSEIRGDRSVRQALDDHAKLLAEFTGSPPRRFRWPVLRRR